MASTLSTVCFIRCPKCLRVLAEFPHIPLFRCYGCDAILKANVHSDISASDNGLAVFVKQISNASDGSKRLAQDGRKRSENAKSNAEINFKEVESSVNEMKTLSISGSCRETRDSAVYELNGINDRSLEEDKVKPTNQPSDNLNQKVRKSSSQIVPEANDSLNSSCKLEEQSPESLEHDIKNTEGVEGLRNGVGFKWKTRSSHAYDRSFSLSDRQQQGHVTQNHLAVSRRTRSSQSYNRSFSLSDRHRQDHVPQMNLALSRRTRSRKVLDSADSIEAAGRDNVMKNSANPDELPVIEKHCSRFSIQSSGNGVQAKEQDALASSKNLELSLIPQSKDADQVVKFHFSETNDELKILEKVDELKIELHRMFSNKSDGKEASSFSIKVTHLEGKIESDDNRSSLFRFSRQSSNSSCSLCHSAGMCSHNGTRRLCQESHIRHCLPVSGGAPFVICYKCYKLLQLPVDFLVSTKRIHRLRCGSCSEVLVYSFRPRPRSAVSRRSLKQHARWPSMGCRSL